ncbi:MAG: hypothetical protein FRX49_01012 [Trebouxia sp. A1-2]|nr:MAG: hypothetical protein FRX49_01012 [Trebouxia sp. A1-2]
MTAVTVALDWTPNTNHAGFYVALNRGYYKAANLNVIFLNPAQDAYKSTPASRVANGQATFAVAPSETVVSYNCQPKSSAKPHLQSVAALLQSDTSAIVTLQSSGLDRPRKLDGKTYASYGARYEGRIVQQMIKNDGGKGEYTEATPPMLGIWETVLAGKADATWVFMGWEGIEAKRKGIKLNAFSLEDFDIPYGYSPVLVTTQDILREQGETVRSFLAATTRGYQYAAEAPEAAGELMCQTVTEQHDTPLDVGWVVDSMQMLSEHFLTKDGLWGVQDKTRWERFLDWLSDRQLLTTSVQSRKKVKSVTASLDDLRSGKAGEIIPRNSLSSDALFTNAFLPQGR